MAIREGRWDCVSCGRRGNLGRQLSCQGCGDMRPEGVRFYLPEDAPAVTDPELLKTARNGPDWICDYCEASNREGGGVCKQCGADRDSGRRQQTRLIRFRQETVRRASVAADYARPLMAQHPVAVKLAAVGVPVFILLLFLFFRTYEVPAIVVGVQWERTQEIEILRTEREEDWSVPAAGRLVDSRRAVHHYEQVLDHYETRTRTVYEPDWDSSSDSGSGGYDSWSGGDSSSYDSTPTGTRDLGNGFFEDTYDVGRLQATRTETYQEPIYRSEPVYRTKYTYDIDRWRHSRNVRAAGRDHNPRWPRYNLRTKERAGDRREAYTVKFRSDDGKAYSRGVSLAEFPSYRQGLRATLGVNLFGQVRWVKPKIEM